MRQIFPKAVDDVDPVAVYASDDRSGDAADRSRPWLMVNMISSVDGGVTVDGLSGGLGGEADKAVFTAIRAVPDIILVAAGTVRAENYRRPQPPPEIRTLRTERGQAPFPRLAIVTNNLSLSADHRVFDPDAPPLIVTAANAPADRRRELSAVAELIDAGQDHVDLGAALELLGERGAQVVLGEGGPTLNGALVADGLVDELCLSLSPLLTGGDGPRIVDGERTPDSPRKLRLDRILEQDDLTFHRYVRS